MSHKQEVTCACEGLAGWGRVRETYSKPGITYGVFHLPWPLQGLEGQEGIPDLQVHVEL